MELQNKKNEEKLENDKIVLLEKENTYKIIIKNKDTEEKGKYNQLESKFNEIFTELGKVNNEYSNFNPNLEPLPRKALYNGKCCGLEIIAISRIPASIRTESG